VNEAVQSHLWCGCSDHGNTRGQFCVYFFFIYTLALTPTRSAPLIARYQWADLPEGLFKWFDNGRVRSLALSVLLIRAQVARLVNVKNALFRAPQGIHSECGARVRDTKIRKVVEKYCSAAAGGMRKYMWARRGQKNFHIYTISRPTLSLFIAVSLKLSSPPPKREQERDTERAEELFIFYNQQRVQSNFLILFY